jgi:hypothetical protein
MNKSEKLKLIEGLFLCDDAKEVLMNVFSTKIQYHKLKNFSSQERFGKDDVFAQNRIHELKNEIIKFEKMIEEARLNNQRIVISSEIKITLTD